jgi:hypothetical protein
MKTSSLTIIAASAVLLSLGCSRESREETIDNVASAARALNGGDSDERTPDIVRKQQEAERKRQNSEWTAENQAKHPIEYCQAQLKAVDEMAKKLEVEQHKLNTTRAEQNRKVSENADIIKKMSEQLSTLKASYREAEASGTWPITFNGFQLSQQKTKEFIVQTGEKLKAAQEQAPKIQNLLSRIERRLGEIQKEQINLVQTRDKINMTLSNLQTKQVIEGERGIADALKALNDSMESLGGSLEDPSFEDISAGTRESELDDAFNALMAE